MHLIRRFAIIVLSLGLSASLVGCGFQLRGAQIKALPTQYQSVQLALPDNAQDLEKPLKVYLSNLGAQVNQTHALTRLKVTDYELKRRQFRGKLTEVQLHMSATFQIENMQGEPLTAPRTVISQRTYQYDIATVNTERQEEQFFIKVMNEDIAQQIIRQLHTNRLPTAVLDQAPE